MYLISVLCLVWCCSVGLTSQWLLSGVHFLNIIQSGEKSKKQCKRIAVVVHHQRLLLEFGNGGVHMRLVSLSLSLSLSLDVQGTWRAFFTQGGMDKDTSNVYWI